MNALSRKYLWGVPARVAPHLDVVEPHDGLDLAERPRRLEVGLAEHDED